MAYSRRICKIVMFLLVFAWTVYLKPEAQVGPFKGKEKICLITGFSMAKFYVQGKTKNSKKIYYIPYSSVSFIVKEK